MSVICLEALEKVGLEKDAPTRSYSSLWRSSIPKVVWSLGLEHRASAEYQITEPAVDWSPNTSKVESSRYRVQFVLSRSPRQWILSCIIERTLPITFVSNHCDHPLSVLQHNNSFAMETS